MASTPSVASEHAPHHLPRAVIEARLEALPQGPSGLGADGPEPDGPGSGGAVVGRLGTIELIVSRLPDGVRATPDRTLLTPSGGVPGDAWGRGADPDPEAQITVMRQDVASVIADGRPATLFGDNLFVDLDLSAANQPVGRRWRVGDAILEVSPKPHNGCLKFRDRFGPDALAAVQDRLTRHHNRRGVYWRVVQAGEVWVGATIEALDPIAHA